MTENAFEKAYAEISQQVDGLFAEYDYCVVSLGYQRELSDLLDEWEAKIPGIREYWWNH